MGASFSTGSFAPRGLTLFPTGSGKIGTEYIVVSPSTILGLTVSILTILGGGVTASSTELVLSDDDSLDESYYGMCSSISFKSSSLFALITDISAAIWSLNGALSYGIISRLGAAILNKAKALN